MDDDEGLGDGLSASGVAAGDGPLLFLGVDDLGKPLPAPASPSFSGDSLLEEFVESDSLSLSLLDFSSCTYFSMKSWGTTSLWISSL